MKKFAKLISAALACVMVILSLTGCGEKKPADVIGIGGIGPATGGAAVYGLAVKNAAELAVEEINANGGINGTKLKFNFQDDEHDAEKAVNAYNSLKDWGMQVLMGTVTTKPCLAVAPEAYNDNIFLLTPSASAVGVIKEDNAFQVCFSDPNQGSASAKYIADNSLAKKVAVIYDSTDAYSSGIYDAFCAKAAEIGIEIVSAGAFTEDSKTDFSVQIGQAKAKGAELVFLPIYAQEASLILKQSKDAGYSPKFFGCDGLDGILSLVNFDISLASDIMLLTPFAADAKDAATQKFVKAYQEKYKEVPNQFAADAYDAIMVIAECMKKGNVTADMSAEDICAIMKQQIVELKYPGLTGAGEDMTWNAKGEVSKEPTAVRISITEKDGVKTGTYVAM